MKFKRSYFIVLALCSFSLLLCNKNVVLASEKSSDGDSSDALSVEVDFYSEVTSESYEDLLSQSDQEEFISIWDSRESSKYMQLELRGLRETYPGIDDSRNYKEIAKTPQGIEALKKYIRNSSNKHNKLVALNILYPGINKEYDYQKMAETPEGRELVLEYAGATCKRNQALEALKALFPQIERPEIYSIIAQTPEGREALRIYINITDDDKKQLKALKILVISEAVRERAYHLSKASDLCNYSISESELISQANLARIASTPKGREAVMSIAKISESVKVQLNAIKALFPQIGEEYDYKKITQTPEGILALCIYITIEENPNNKAILLEIVEALFPNLADIDCYSKMIYPSFAPTNTYYSRCREVLNLYNTIKNEIQQYGRVISIIEYDSLYSAYKFCSIYFSNEI